MTYTALLTLLILRDDLSDVNPKGVMAGVRHLQKEDGRSVAVFRFIAKTVTTLNWHDNSLGIRPSARNDTPIVNDLLHRKIRL